MDEIDFSNKVVLVTGGGAGIGRGTVGAFAGLGATVVALEVDEGRAGELRTTAGDVAALAATIDQRFGRLDVPARATACARSSDAKPRCGSR